MNTKTLFAILVTVLLNRSLYAVTDKTLNIGILQEWDVVHPVSYGTAASEAIMHMLRREMSFQDEKGIIQPEAAVSLPSLKNKKAKIITDKGVKKVVAEWEIKKEVVWSDNTPVTCADWHFSWQVGLSPNVATSEREIYSKIEKIEWVPEKNKICKVTYANANWTFDRDLPPFLPRHLEASVFEKFKDKAQAYDQNTNYVTNPSLAGLYNGPYVVKEIKLKSHVILTANPNFWGEKPKISTVIVKLITDSNTFRPYLETKQINMISPVGNPPDLAIALANEEQGKSFRVQFINSPLYQALFFNLENEFLKEKAIRQALSLVIDKEKIVKSFFSGKLNPAYTILAENDPAFINKKYSVDTKKAAQILDQAGWKMPAGQKGDDVIREKNGKKLIVEYKTSAGLRILESIQGFICSEFQKINIGCSIKNQPPREFLGDSVPKGNFAIGKYGNTTLFDSSLKGQYHSTSIPKSENSWAGGNSGRLVSKDLDKLLEKYDSSWDRSERNQLLKKIDDLIQTNVWQIPLYHRREAVVLPSTFTGYTNSVRGTAFVYPERWDF